MVIGDRLWVIGHPEGNFDFVELRLMSNKLQLLGNAKAFFVATDANAPRRRRKIASELSFCSLARALSELLYSRLLNS